MTDFAERDITARSARPEMREIATTQDGRDITRGYVEPMMVQPTTDSILLLRGAGDYEIYKLMLMTGSGATWSHCWKSCGHSMAIYAMC